MILSIVYFETSYLRPNCLPNDRQQIKARSKLCVMFSELTFYIVKQPKITKVNVIKTVWKLSYLIYRFFRYKHVTCFQKVVGIKTKKTKRVWNVIRKMTMQVLSARSISWSQSIQIKECSVKCLKKFNLCAL